MSAVHSNISVFVPHLGCPHRCSFCNQHYIARTVSVPVAYDVDSAVAAAQTSKRYDPETTEIAFFGGSFTAIERGYMVSLLEAAKKYVDSGIVSGIRVSTRPDAIDGEILSLLKSFGVTCIELGAQSMDDSVLAANERGHRAADVINSSLLIKEYGIALGLQMMTGLFTDTADEAVKTAAGLIELKPDCVRIYPTITLKNTRLAELYAEGKYTPMSLEETIRLCVNLSDMFDAASIPVIRLGLHTIDPDAYVAGPWHPAFCELCETEKYSDILKRMLKGKGSYTVHVAEKNLSKAIGQSRSNVKRFSKMGYELRFVPDSQLENYEVIIR